jgi:CubicO group peptidase (beta-lactamase class C family)
MITLPADFSGVAMAGEEAVAQGYAHRAYRIPNMVDTRFGIASGSKGMTALTVVSLIEQGALALDTPARSVLGDDLPLIAGDVTIEHLLAHRSGIGDYLDEEAGHAITDYVMPVPVHELATTPQFLAVLGGHPAKFPAGSRFAYCNGGFVVLALIAERVGGAPFHDLVRDRVLAPAGMHDSGYFRSDELPPRTAVGYVSDVRSNVFHLPVRGSGDGGLYATVADVSAFWSALFAGRIVGPAWVAEMVRPRSDVPSESLRYGLGFWLHASTGVVMLEGYDAGVSFRSTHDPATGQTRTVVSNTSGGAWPVAALLDEI